MATSLSRDIAAELRKELRTMFEAFEKRVDNTLLIMAAEIGVKVKSGIDELGQSLRAEMAILSYQVILDPIQDMYVSNHMCRTPMIRPCQLLIILAIPTPLLHPQPSGPSISMSATPQSSNTSSISTAEAEYLPRVLLRSFSRSVPRNDLGTKTKTKPRSELKPNPSAAVHIPHQLQSRPLCQRKRRRAGVGRTVLGLGRGKLHRGNVRQTSD